MSSLLSGVICIIVTMLFLPYLYFLPHATLSGIILMAVIALLKELPHDLKFMWRVRAWKDIVLMIVTFSATVLFSLEIGTAISVVLSLLATIKQSSCPRITVLVSLIIQP
jgi:MFS superfamily sulfate permease-like transporter